MVNRYKERERERKESERKGKERESRECEQETCKRPDLTWPHCLPSQARTLSPVDAALGAAPSLPATRWRQDLAAFESRDAVTFLVP